MIHRSSKKTFAPCDTLTHQQTRLVKYSVCSVAQSFSALSSFRHVFLDLKASTLFQSALFFYLEENDSTGDEEEDAKHQNNTGILGSPIRHCFCFQLASCPSKNGCDTYSIDKYDGFRSTDLLGGVGSGRTMIMREEKRVCWVCDNLYKYVSVYLFRKVPPPYQNLLLLLGEDYLYWIG